ncbi:putative DNA-binding domain-containing protein [Sphingomonas daechungensis]|uniref:DNA-binding domain-containing protein n=1 Tax=Sphingomonas daechungensis TaxID=1176646 RepID=A0ABX6T144_9SPHN|nr:DNA-binding domain-containing protein [Sphingomonas daechungensis]QNP43415.1 putative DNA-binding domain-containing protein [Sphingomonas daechungensis]
MLPDLISFQRQFVGAIDNPATGALSVYRNTVIHGAVEALRSNFPVVEQIVGEEMFEGIAVEFSQAKPPRRPFWRCTGPTSHNGLASSHGSETCRTSLT